MTAPVTGRRILADLEELGVDPAVVRHVRIGLGAIAKEIRDLPDADALVERAAVVALVDPGLAD
jgi:hypothetical protein